MMKRCLSLFCVAAALIVTAQIGSAAEVAKGYVFATLQNRILAGSGDRFYVDLGMKDGVVKGDIIHIRTDVDYGIMNPIGLCSAIKVNKEASICEVAKVSMEIRKGDVAVIKKLQTSDPSLYPAIYKLLHDTAEVYPVEKPVKVYVHNFFDDKNAVTLYSEHIRNEIAGLFSQKSKFTLKKEVREKGFRLYPDSYTKYSAGLESFMKNNDADVFVTGWYEATGTGANLHILKLDRNYGHERFTYQIPLGPDFVTEEMARVIVPYDGIETKDYITTKIVYKDLQFVPTKDQKARTISYEAGTDFFKELDMKRTSFNVVSPVGIKVVLDEEPIDFGGDNEAVIPMPRGPHKLTVSYKRGYFFNTREALIHTSNATVSKTIVLDLDKAKNISIEIVLQPLSESDLIDVKVYNVIEKDHITIKPTKVAESARTIEFFKD